jgi:hypothetical protein
MVPKIIWGVIVSPRKIAPQIIPNTGIKNVTDKARVAPISASKR